MNAALPKNPFSTRYTRPEVVPFLWAVVPPVAGDTGSGATQSGFALSSRFDPGSPMLGTQGQVESSQRLVARLRMLRQGLIVGPHGSGKTSLIHSLLPHLKEAFEIDGCSQVHQLQLTMPLESDLWARFKHRRCARDAVNEVLAGLPGGGLLVVDGIEQLCNRDQKKLIQKTQRQNIFLLATSHQPVCKMGILYQTAVDVMLINSLVNGLLKDASPQVVEIVAAELEKRDLARLTNVRDLWFELYDIVQDYLLVDPMKLRDVGDGCSVIGCDGAQDARDPCC